MEEVKKKKTTEQVLENCICPFFCLLSKNANYFLPETFQLHFSLRKFSIFHASAERESTQRSGFYNYISQHP